MSTDDKDLPTRFHEYVDGVIDEKGVYPFPGMALRQDGKLEIAAITDGNLAYRWFWEQITQHNAAEVIFGLDRTTKPDQGTEFNDVLTCCHWRDGLDGNPWQTSFRIGVIDYQHEPRIVRPWNWTNEFWLERMGTEIKNCRPGFRVRTEKAKA